MDASSPASFGIVCRLTRMLREEPAAAKRSVLVERFLSRVVPSVTDVVLLLELITAFSAPAQQLRSRPLGVHDDADIEAAMRQLLPGEDPHASCRRHGSLLTAKQAHDLATRCRLVGAPATLGDAASCRALLAQISVEDFGRLAAMIRGERSSVIGDKCTLRELLDVIDPRVAAEFQVTGDLERSVSEVVEGLSPRQFAESHFDRPVSPLPLEGAIPGAVPAPVVVAATPAAAVPAGVKRPDRPVDTLTPSLPTDNIARPFCPYGPGCYRKNPKHFTDYRHDAPPGPPSGGPPPAPVVSLSLSHASSTPPAPPLSGHPPIDGGEGSSSRAIRGVAPLTLLPEHQFVTVDGVSGSFKVKYCGNGTYTCACPVWRYQNRATNERTCKHLQQLLGTEYERLRCGMGGAVHMPGVPRPHDEVNRGGATPLGVVGAPVAPVIAGGSKVAIPGLLLAQNSNHPKTDYSGWWMSEKLDGVRAYWTGSVFASRNGNTFTAPTWFTASLPSDFPLDGELFGGRKKFQFTVGVVKSSASHPGWADLVYRVFDSPSLSGVPFESRMETVQAKLMGSAAAAASKYVSWVRHVKATSRGHIAEYFDEVAKGGGEGIMLRQPGSLYVNSRSSTLLKVKISADLDALVVGHDAGAGKHLGRLGALVAQLPNGKQFKVGTGFSDLQRHNPPKVGAVITVRYQELTDGGVPRHPAFAGERADGTWPPVA